MDDLRPWVLGVAVLFLFGSAEVRRFENAAANEIKSKLQGADAVVQVKTKQAGLFGYASGDLSRVNINASHFSTEGLPLFTQPDRPKSGKVGRLNLLLEDFTLAGLKVESLQASIPNCRYDLGLAKRSKKIRLSQSGEGTGAVTLLAPDLEKFILRKFSEIKAVTVALENGLATVQGRGEFLILKADFKVVAKLAPVEGSKLWLTDAQIELDGAPASPEAAQVLLKVLNPVVDLNKDLKLYSAVDVKTVELGGGKLVARGVTRIPNQSEE